MGGNRKARRAAGQASTASTSATATQGSGNSFQPTTEIDEDGVEYILQHPDRSGPKGKTLFDLAEERQRELDKEAGRVRSSTTSQDEDPLPLGPLGDAILYSISMASLHVTLDVIVFTQYREAILWSEIFTRGLTALPIFFLLVYLTHVDFSNRFPLLRNIIFAIGGIAAGCYLVFSGNKHGYYYVMKAAPPVGTLWIWSVVEVDVLYAALNALAVFAYSKWNGFSFF
ncbi:hypothetical protein DM02DRAFT_344959 [Periconia macrospinosa]|uniref:DUF7719 domain-containing protein n=1 Tax=Periconia macrospinosa TaxID=97972 RepID=A0A2V1DU19_9PLEO|nr:hypothetical protein DM02DRAFT_344959 [Periconia macrospinosa]